MNVRTKIFSVSLAFLGSLCLMLFVPVSAMGQSNSVSGYSPYSIFGIGELNFPGTVQMRSMGGVGVAWRSSQMVNILNPAGFSATPRQGILFDVGVDASFTKNTQHLYDDTQAFAFNTYSVKNTVNLRSIALQLPLAKRLGLGVSMTPYSSVGYKMDNVEANPDIWAEAGEVMYSYQGDGDVTEVKFGLGWEPFRNFSIGFAAKYFWGHIERDYASSVATNISNTQVLHTVTGSTIYDVSSFKFQCGVQWNAIADKKHLLTLGATYDYGGRLYPYVKDLVIVNTVSYAEASSTESGLQIRLPHSLNVGLMYQTAKLIVGADYMYQGWGSNDGYFENTIYGGIKVRYRDTNTYKIGLEYTPNRFDVRHYMKRVNFRLGFRYSDSYQMIGGKTIDEYAVTAGFGFPLRFLGSSSLNIGLEFGGKGDLSSVYNQFGDRVGLVRQKYFKISLGMSLFGEDYWFVRPKFD